MSYVFPRHTKARYPVAVGGEGPYLIDGEGRRYIDASGGAAVSCLGHGHPAVIQAIKDQVDKIAYAHSAFFTTEASEALAEYLVRRAPEGLARVYFVSGGSEAVESCIKLARQWAVATGQPRRWKIVTRFPSYHGGTLGSLSVTGDDALAESFRPLMQAMPTVPAPITWRDRDNFSMEERGLRYADLLEEKILEEGPETVLAFIMEPILGGRAAISGGFTEDEARNLAALIASGPLPDGLSILSLEALPSTE